MWAGIPEGVNPRIYLLWLIRSGRVRDWASLAEEFGIDLRTLNTAQYQIFEYLESLKKAGLIVIEYASEGKDYLGPERIPQRIELSENWRRIQLALDVSLREMTRLGPSAIISTPYFGKPKSSAEGTDLFVLMPFDAQLKPVYEDHIAASARELGLRVARGDDFFTSHSVMADIWAAIMSARAVIADCTGRNPNVFYEIGLAHAVGKPVILITQNNDDVPFDIRHLRYIQYDYTPRGMRIFEKRLTDTLRTELGLRRQGARFGVFFMVADDSTESHLELEQESTAIKTALGQQQTYLWDAKQYRPGFEFPFVEDVLLGEDPPTILHVIGHANGPDALRESSDKGGRKFAPARLAESLRRTAPNLRCLILSRCYEEEQAAAIATVVANVIGVRADLGQAATSYVVDFYKSLNAGRSVADAHEIGCNRARLEGVTEDRLPVLLTGR
jgi:nucleoside 2-deoxyribosyltransferase